MIGARVEPQRLGWRTRTLAFLARRFGPQFVLPTISTLEQRDSNIYDHQPEAVAGGLPQGRDPSGVVCGRHQQQRLYLLW